ncbi:hypothetical protein KP509_34G068600 [Ceratopteris richardii]|uniref:Uncharacterized protein n=2 Tax=Ceratopteris richardii TaxID=49495 RepID=A0A8T2QMC2_CERRI|nr:hypothetical protein KP509_34G068600 [Ceratopteris richardii]
MCHSQKSPSLILRKNYVHPANLQSVTFGFESICTQSSAFDATCVRFCPMPLSFTQGFADFPHLSGHSTQAYILYIDLHHCTVHSLQTEMPTV